jgi:uncharacterized protein YdhG (YjbR/CyaY superfamily)
VPNNPQIDAYLATLPEAQADALRHVRDVVARVAPRAEQKISYGMPAFYLNGRFLVSYAGWKRHCSLYPLTDSFLEDHRDALAGFDQTKGSVHFTPERPLPDDLLTELIQGRLADLEDRRQ